MTYAQEYDGDLNFTTDCWTAPNHRPFVAVLVHFEWQGAGICIPLDVVEVAKSHTGAELGDAFAQMLVDFGLQEKVRALVGMIMSLETALRKH